MEDKKYLNYIDALLRLYECDKKSVPYSLNGYIEGGIVVKGEYGNYTVSDGERGGYFDVRYLTRPNEVVYEVMKRLDISIPQNKFYLLRDKFLELNKDLVEELLSDRKKFWEEVKLRNIIYLNGKNLYYDITMLNISNYLNSNIKYADKKQFLANIIYSLYILKPKKSLEEELIKSIERKFPN